MCTLLRSEPKRRAAFGLKSTRILPCPARSRKPACANGKAGARRMFEGRMFENVERNVAFDQILAYDDFRNLLFSAKVHP